MDALVGSEARPFGQEWTIFRLGRSMGRAHPSGRSGAPTGGTMADSSDIRTACWALLTLCTAVSLSGCANDPPLAPPPPLQPSDPLVEIVQLRAGRGDKNAQLELGVRYEEGRGVPRDLDRAEHWYRRAARDARRPSQVYSPAVGPHGRARILSVRGGGFSRGLPEARRRLRELREMRSRGRP
jgi:TPR repeat protein